LLLLLPVLLLIIAAPPAQAGTSGKVSGEVIDSETGEPVVGATVRVSETNLATKTDDDGEFFIINIPVGKYDLTVTSVGYEAVQKRQVRVLVDLTTPVDFELDRQTIELGQEVVVYATNPVIQQDLTESKIIFTSDRLKNLPNIETVQSVLTNYPGVVVQDGDLHIRGGRSGQVSYYYDGFSVQDPFYSSTGIRIIPGALEELSLTSGGYTAEYGDAMSGVVNAVTREGGPEYHGGIRMYEGATRPYDVSQGTWGEMKRTGNRSLGFDLSGPIPGLSGKRYNFFAAGEYLTDAGYLPHDGITSYSFTSKLTAQPGPHLKLNANLSYYQSDGDIYEHRDVNGVSYDFNLDGLPSFEKEAYLFGITANYNINERLIFTSSMNRFRTYTHTAPSQYMDTYWDEWDGYGVDESGEYNGTIQDDNYLGYQDFEDPYQAVGFTVGDDYNPIFQRREAIYNAGRVGLLAQLHKSHQAKIGFEYRRYDIDWDSKQFYNSNPYGEKYTSNPYYLSGFLNDKMEFQDLVVNLGMRIDYRNADIKYNAAPSEASPIWEKAESRTRVSPRLGVSFPLAEHTVMHFNYGVYYQVPQYQYMYTNLQGDLSTGLPLLGNPNLEPEQTISYELGLDHMLTPSLRIDITAYSKDIEDLVTTRELSALGVGSFAVIYDNGDHGTVKGFDVALEKLAGNGPLSASISYGYMQATGINSSATEPYYTYLSSTTDTLAPKTEYPLDYDQRHTVTAVVDLRIPEKWGGKFLGMSLPGAWGINMVGHYGSGLPYTPTDAFGNRLGERNEARLPATFTVDTRLNKDFNFSAYQAVFFLEVDNLFDRRNVLNVYSRTGQPDDDGQQSEASLATNADLAERLDTLYDLDPQNYSTPRTMRLGVELHF